MKESTIVTFYSYKGGVGRSQLLANLASYLCHYHGRKILLIDWDLEAPGINFFFEKKSLTNQNGLIDLLNQYTTSLLQTTSVDEQKISDFSDGFINSLVFPNGNGGSY